MRPPGCYPKCPICSRLKKNLEDLKFHITFKHKCFPEEAEEAMKNVEWYIN